MATDYYSEGIERITEQMLEQDVLNDIADIRSDAIKYVKDTWSDTSKELISIGNDAVSQAEDIKNKYLEYSAKEEADMVQQLADTGIRKTLNQIDADVEKIYQQTVAIAQNTEDKIENNIRTMIAEKGYKMNFSDDGNGNVIMTLVRGDE